MREAAAAHIESRLDQHHKWMDEQLATLTKMQADLDHARDALAAASPGWVMRQIRRAYVGDRLPVAYRWTLPIAIAVQVIALAFVSFGSTMWLPVEAIHTSQGHTLVGYVVDQSDGTTTFLTDSDRRVIEFRTSDVSTREVCERSTPWPFGGQSLAQLVGLAKRANEPRCPGGVSRKARPSKPKAPASGR